MYMMYTTGLVKHILTAIVVAIIVGVIGYVADDRLGHVPLMLILAVVIYIISKISKTLFKKYSKKIVHNTAPPLEGFFN
ncbi:hypothetical protein ACEQPO_21060 [Bacillus sp. SL00103]